MLLYVKSVNSTLPLAGSAGLVWQLAHFALPLNSENPRVSLVVNPLPVSKYVSNLELNELTSSDRSYSAIERPIIWYAFSMSSKACKPHTFMNRIAYFDCFTLSTTTPALALFCSNGFRNGPIACSASGSPSVRPVARPSQNMPPVQPFVASRCKLGLSPPYAIDGGFLLPNRPLTAPSYAAPARSVSSSGPVHPTCDPWHPAQARPAGSERWVSKNNCLPSHCLSVKPAGLVFSGAG